MKLRGYFWRETALARHISPTPSEDGAVWVPQDRTTSFRKLPCPNPIPVPREVEFSVEGWLLAKPEFRDFKAT